MKHDFIILLYLFSREEQLKPLNTEVEDMLYSCIWMSM